MLRIVTGIAAATFALGAVAAPESYTIDSSHSHPHFVVNHLGFMDLTGRFDKMSGKFVLDNAAKTGSVEISIEAASISTGDSDRGSRPRSRDEHLRAPDFFNVAEFPRISFKGTAGKWTSDAPTTVQGEFTMLGVTKPLTLTVDRWKCGPDPRTKGKRYMCGGHASGTIKRSDFGMKFGIPNVGDEVKLNIGFEAFRD